MLHPLGTARQSRGYSIAHPAIDWPAPTGTPVRAAETGIVVAAGPDSAAPYSRDLSGGGGGIIVTIDHGGGAKTLYAHLSGVTVRLGQQVAKGQPIGFVGATGTTTGPHLHFVLGVNGRRVDPAPYLAGGTLPKGADVPSSPQVCVRRDPSSSGTFNSAGQVEKMPVPASGVCPAGWIGPFNDVDPLLPGQSGPELFGAVAGGLIEWAGLEVVGRSLLILIALLGLLVLGVWLLVRS